MNRVFGRIKQTNDQVGILNFGISDFDAFFFYFLFSFTQSGSIGKNDGVPFKSK